MAQSKKELISNLNFQIIESINKKCIDVKCTYKYQGKSLNHYFSYIKKTNNPNFYINKAKADMDRIIQSNYAERIIKKDINANSTSFFKRHKKPLLICICTVLLVGIAVATTLLVLNNLGIKLF